jgi:phosphate transport system substrate-binding protein
MTLSQIKIALLICFSLFFYNKEIFAKDIFTFDFFKEKEKKRSELYLVGSSTISPLISSVAEEFTRNQNLKNKETLLPIVESTGTREGFRLFCLGVGYKYPDFVNASHSITANDLENCSKNGVNHIGEIKIGYDGIVIGNSKEAEELDLQKKHIFLALANNIPNQKTGELVKNHYQFWNEIDKNLPHKKIKFLVPPLSSGTRMVFIELVMEEFCLQQETFIKAFPNHKERKEQCGKFREDSVVINSGENDNNLIQKLKEDKQAIGIFGFHFLVENSQSIKAISINKIKPSKENISSKKYHLSRPLFVYFKKEHLELVPEMKDFIKELISKETIGNNGYLVHSGLVSLEKKELKNIQEKTLSELNESK